MNRPRTFFRWSLGPWVGLALLVLAPAAQAQPVDASAPRVVALGSDAPFRLMQLGPTFTAPWLADVLPRPLHAGAPKLQQRVIAPAGAGPSTRVQYIYRADGQLRLQRTETRTEAGWSTSERTRFIYRSGRLVAQEQATRQRGRWQPVRRLAMQYDTQGTLRRVVHQERGKPDAWTTTARLVVAQNGLQLRYETRTADGWHPVTRVTFEVAEEGRHVVQHHATWTDARWAPSMRITYLYDGAGYPIEKSMAFWAGETWAEGPLYFYDYQIQGDRVEQRTETWIGANRIRAERMQLTYTAPVQPWLLGEAAAFD